MAEPVLRKGSSDPADATCRTPSKRLGTILDPLTGYSGKAPHLDGGSIFDPSRPSICPRILTWNDFAPSTNSMRTVRDEVGTTRVLDGPGKRIGLS